MADFNALTALINAYIKQNGVKAITGQILNGVLTGMVSALGKGYTVAGEASPTTDPGTMTGPVAYIAHAAGTYEHFGNLVVNQGEVAMLIFDEAVWRKEVLLSLSANATVDANVGTPEVTCTFVDGVLTFDFRNMKGNPGVDGDAAGFGTINATVDSNVGTPGVSVQTSGPDTAKNITFQFTNLKGETGVTSVVATVDNTTGTPTCSVSLVGQELHLDFSGLKGAQGDTGSSVDYPFTIVNNLTTNDATQALSAAMGVELASQVSQLEHKVDEIHTGIHIITEDELPELTHYKDGNQLLASTQSYGIALNNVIVSGSANYRNVRIPVEGYFAARYNSYGSNYNYGCLLVDENDIVVGVLNKPSTDPNPVIFVIPTRAKYFIYSYNINATYSRDVELFKKEALSEIDGLEIETVGDTLVCKEMELLKTYNFMSYGALVPVIGQSVSLSSFVVTDANAVLRRNVLINLDGISSFRAWIGRSAVGQGSAILDQNMVITRAITNANDSQYFDFTVAEGDKFLLFSFAHPSDDKDEVTLYATGKLNDRITVLESKIEEIGGGASSIVTGLTPILYKGKTSQNGATVPDDYNLTTETIFGDFWLKLADGFKVLEASLFDREGNIVSYQIVHPDVSLGSRIDRSFFSTGNTVQQYGYRFVICKTDGTAIEDGETAITDFVSMQDSGLHRWIPDDLPNYDVALRRLDYIQHLRWIPLAKVPNSYGTNVANDYFCLAGRVQIGVPYSDVAETRKYVPNCVSIRTFMTATKNKRSLLYTEELQSNISKYGMAYEGGNRRAYYGEVCCGFTAWVMGLDTLYLSGNYSNDAVPGMSSVASPNANNVRPLDFMWSSGHITIISDIWKDEFGKVKFVVVSEMATPYPYRTLYTPAQFEARLSAISGTVHRWTGWANLVEPESLPKYSQYTLGALPYNFPVNEDIMTFAGDYASFADGDIIHINARRNSTYTGVELYKNDVLLQTIDITGLSADTIVTPNTEDWVDVNLTALNLTAGKYKARLTDGANTTDYTYFEVVGVTFSATKNGSDLVSTFSSADGGTPVSIEQCQTSGFAYKYHPVTPSEATAGTVTLSGWEYHSYYPKLYLLVKGDYGTVCKRIDVPQS